MVGKNPKTLETPTNGNRRSSPPRSPSPCLEHTTVHPVVRHASRSAVVSSSGTSETSSEMWKMRRTRRTLRRTCDAASHHRARFEENKGDAKHHHPTALRACPAGGPGAGR